MSWNEDNVRELRRLWDAGYSAAAIGRQIGLSKNAVIGKAHRLGLKARPSPIKRGAARVIVEPLQPKQQPPAPPVETTPVMRSLPPAPRKIASGPSCLWPIGDPGDTDFHFCGRPAMQGKPYCTDHCAKAYITRTRTDTQAA
jgi:GcrA cell cycle regulator